MLIAKWFWPSRQKIVDTTDLRFLRFRVLSHLLNKKRNVGWVLFFPVLANGYIYLQQNPYCFYAATTKPSGHPQVSNKSPQEAWITVRHVWETLAELFLPFVFSFLSVFYSLFLLFIWTPHKHQQLRLFTSLYVQKGVKKSPLPAEMRWGKTEGCGRRGADDWLEAEEK